MLSGFVLVAPHLFDAGFEAYFVFVQQPKGLVLVKALLFVGQCLEINEINLAPFNFQAQERVHYRGSKVKGRSQVVASGHFRHTQSAIYSALTVTIPHVLRSENEYSQIVFL